MYCAAYATAHVLGRGWTRDRVWLHVRALREARGEPVPVHPRGGIRMSDVIDLLAREGFTVKTRTLKRRTTLAAFRRVMRQEGGRWILGQPGHVFGHTPSSPACPGRPHDQRVFLNRAWHIIPVPAPVLGGGESTE